MNIIKQVGSSLKQNAKQTAKQVARQLAQEPLEILKTASRQAGVAPETGQDQSRQTQGPGQENQQTVGPTPQEKAKRETQSVRLMQAYEAELKEIKQKKVQEEAEKGQEEIAQVQEEQKEKAEKGNILQVVSKKGRKMFGKIGVKREQTKVEMRQPPSG